MALASLSGPTGLLLTHERGQSISAECTVILQSMVKMHASFPEVLLGYSILG